jgi:hypothetical protein
VVKQLAASDEAWFRLCSKRVLFGQPFDHPQ